MLAVGGRPRLARLAEPVAGPGTTLVRVHAAALGHLDRTVAAGQLPGAQLPPYVPCGDGSGVVLDSAVHPRGTLVWLRGGGLGVTRDGLAAEIAAVPDQAVHRAPSGADPLLAAVFFSPATSAWTALTAVGQLRPGERVAVTGAAGAVGSLAVQLALEGGAGAVVAAVSRPERAAAVPAGAEVVVGDLDDDAEPVDLLVDTVGGPGLPARLRAVVPGGRAVLVGYTAGTTVGLDLPALMRHDVALLPLNMLRRAPEAYAQADRLLTRLSAGELCLPVAAYPLSDVDRAWQDLATGRVLGRVALLPEEGSR